MAWRTLQTILVPAVVFGGYFLASDVGGFLQSAWDDFLGPFLIAYWVGLGFTYAWDIVRESVKDARPGVVAATVGLTLLVLVAMVGPASLVEDPWLFGVVVWPGIELAMPYLRGQRMTSDEEGQGDPPPGQR